MKTKAARTILHEVTQPTLGELLLGFKNRDLQAILRAYGAKASTPRLENVARLIEMRDRLRGNIRISIHGPGK